MALSQVAISIAFLLYPHSVYIRPFPKLSVKNRKKRLKRGIFVVEQEASQVVMSWQQNLSSLLAILGSIVILAVSVLFLWRKKSLHPSNDAGQKLRLFALFYF